MQNAGESGVHSLVCLVTPCCTPVINTALTAIFEKNNKTPNKLSKKTCTFPYVKVFFAMSENLFLVFLAFVISEMKLPSFSCKIT